MSKGWQSLGDIYNNNVRKNLYEDVNVKFTYPDGDIEDFDLEDSYARVVSRQLRVSASNDVENNIQQIFNAGSWTGNQGAPMKNLKDIIINTNYGFSIELSQYLAENKSQLLSREQLPIAQTFNFVEYIKGMLPDKFITPELDDFIREVHLRVIPKAATGVGLGEGTFSIFGTASKGSSGDLQWDGAEVEIKTNGPNNGSGAILGGDGYINKVTDRLESVNDYVNLKANELQQYSQMLLSINEFYSSGDIEKASAEWEQFKKKSKNLLANINNPSLKALINNANVEQLHTIELASGSFKPRKVPSGNASNIFINRFIERIQHGINTASSQGSNLSSQIAMFLNDDQSAEDYVNVFTELRTYEKTSVNLKQQLSSFFGTRDHTEFNPRNNFQSFSRLIGAIAIICYQKHIGFDYITAGNDDKMTMAIIDCTSPDVSSVYNQLDKVPNIGFDLNIDVYEGGKFKSQTVIAKSPRIVLL